MMTMARVAAQVLVTVGAILIGAADVGRAQVGESRGLVNPNLASVAELSELSGLTPAIVDGLVERRPFLTMTDLNAYLSAELEGSELDAVYQTLFLPINLNTATRQEILLVPGVGDRMAHEFEEYRPYRSLAQFRREIGKYVDDDEVARFERHVFVPIDLNTASDEAILSIPGLGPRMLHEFKEYRPYRALEQFRREIGKYVDDDEVARLERYVVVG
jgi:DNA uptake protein ComE-like DNA-binding protein